MSNTIISKNDALDVIQRIGHRKIQTPIESVSVKLDYLDRKITMDLNVEGQDVYVDEHVQQRLLRMAGLSRKFLENCDNDVDLAQRAVDQGIHALRKSNNKYLGIGTVNDSGRSRAVSIDPQEKAIDTMSMVEVWNAIRDEERLIGISEVTDLNKGHFEIRCVNSNTFSPRSEVGDIVHSGVKISVNGSVTMNPYCFRLRCTNGMQSYEEGDTIKASMESPEDIRNTFRDLSERSLSFTQTFTQTSDIVVPNATEYVMRALRIAGASAALRAKVSDRLIEEAPNSTLYEILNIITAIGRDKSADSPRARNRLEGVAGRVLAMQAGAARCSKCDSRV